MGLDAEWVYDPDTQSNIILSIQLFVPPQPALCVETPQQQRAFARLSRVILSRAPTPEGRPMLKPHLRRLLKLAQRFQLIRRLPQRIYVVGFGLRFDLAALGDFPELKTQVDTASGKVMTINESVPWTYRDTLVSGQGITPLLINLHFIDAAAHVPEGSSLFHLGQLLGLPKLEIPAPHSIERMDAYLRDDPAGYRAYALRDAEIAVRYTLRLADFVKTELKITRFPATASALAVQWCLRTLKEANIDYLAAFGLQQTTSDAYHAATRRRRSYTQIAPTSMRGIQEQFLTNCYAGGRNESFYLGPSPVGEWFDYDLAGAYSTGLVDLPLIDFERPRNSLDVQDYLGHVAGYALIDFVHPPDTRFPVFAIPQGSRGLVFPLEGTAYATAPELRVAHELGCRITIKWGVILPWRGASDAPDPADLRSVRLFRPFVTAARQLRATLKARGGQDSLEEQAVKLYANAVYGKAAQALRPKTVFDTRRIVSASLPPSPFTNPAIAAHVTGFIRAILAEILNRIPRHRTVLSVTTDGFLTDARRDELDLSGPLCQRFQHLCEELVPGSQMLEVKHQVAQVVCMKTRGQLTGLALPEQKIVLAKAGVQVLVAARPTLDAEAYKRLQNETMLDLYLAREPGQQVPRWSFPSLRDQWEKGIDLVKSMREVSLSLEPDLKRRLVHPRLIEVASRGHRHLAMETRPWRTIDEFQAARAQLDVWRQTHCLKTLEDWTSLDTLLVFNRVRARLRALGKGTMNLRADHPLSDVLRRAFLRAYAHRALGLTQTLSYQQLATWLTEIGAPTKVSEPSSARSKPLLLGVAPRTPEIMDLWQRLQERFPEADLAPLLADEDD